MRRSLTLKMSLVGAILTLGAFAADDRATKDTNKGKADASFVEDAFVIGQSEIKLSQLAVNQSSNPAVKDLAQQMIDDHTKANDALKDIAQKKSFMLPYDAVGSSGQTGSTGTGVSGSGSIGTTGATGSDMAGAGSPGSDTTGSAGTGSIGSTRTGNTGSTGSGTSDRTDRADRAGSGSTGTTGSGSIGTTGSGSTGSTGTGSVGATGSTDTYGSAAPATGSVGATANYNYNTTMSSDQKSAQKKYDELAKLSGEKFDKAFITQLNDDHKKAIRAFEKESKSGVDSELKTWASNTLPTLRHHLEMVQSVEKDLKTRRGSM